MVPKAVPATIALLTVLCSSYGLTGRASTLNQGDNRTGRVYAYNENIQPDQPTRIYLPAQGTDDDPALQAALEWLRSQPSCTR